MAENAFVFLKLIIVEEGSLCSTTWNFEEDNCGVIKYFYYYCYSYLMLGSVGPNITVYAVSLLSSKIVVTPPHLQVLIKPNSVIVSTKAIMNPLTLLSISLSLLLDDSTVCLVSTIRDSI